MSSHRKPIVRIARVVLEALTPLSISTGSPDGVFDTDVVTDANGLPAIPASSLVGVLRHLWLDSFDEESADSLFGFQRQKEAKKSSVSASWAVLLDSQHKPVEGLLLGEDRTRLNSDPLLAAAAALSDDPVFRNRVRLTHKGAAAHRGKFDRSVVPAGYRFAFELSMDGATDAEWTQLLSLLAHPGLRLGGGTRAGLGKVACRRLHERSFDLKDPKDAECYRKLSSSVGDTGQLEERQGMTARDSENTWLNATLHLKAVGPWRIGQGTPDPGDERKPADFLPVTESRVRWDGSSGRESDRELLVPASALKGALAHRFRFHAHRLAGRWANHSRTENGALVDPVCPESDALFGVVSGQDQGQAGCVYLDDVFLDPEQPARQRVMHNSIDRFTGGVRDRVLFEEECLIGGEFEIPLALDYKRLERAAESEEELERIRQAMALAVRDLLEGRLALGSRTTSGNGFFNGTMTGTLTDWLAPAGSTKEAEDG
ncbi:hypothetical protein HFP89_01850 [Wenzhouxiangella sp. XN79A]|uniref:RAMP superfamily CRISPR-associated protein n=1 Tax=Wenzhouxiangella sp. XN79A TaxID=2724193 RepID=UPI00144AD1F9|nr:RAMP superfamily CRISPR-associated protein [Wenzhouxiangella sp. XN79A]NKI33907.1 hypothetical protein [Wenzhouxiangella sp. XN79A]